MNETLKLWLTPEGIMVAVMGLIALGWLIVKGLRASGNTEAADKVAALLTRAETAEKVLGSVMTGVQKFKMTAGPKEVGALIDTLRSTNQENGVEEIVAPIVKDLATTPLPAEVVVRTATARITRKVS